jgi:hypothetical protein
MADARRASIGQADAPRQQAPDREGWQLVERRKLWRCAPPPPRPHRIGRSRQTSSGDASTVCVPTMWLQHAPIRPTAYAAIGKATKRRPARDHDRQMQLAPSPPSTANSARA